MATPSPTSRRCHLPSEESDSMSVIELLPLAPAAPSRAPLRGERTSPRPHPPDLRPHRAHAPPDMVILPEFVGKRIAVHNGRAFVEIEVRPEMIGHYLGSPLDPPKRRAQRPRCGCNPSSKHAAEVR